MLGNVIDARKLHHKHFYSLNVDYGHQAYVDKLISQRHIVVKAMQRVEKRTTQVLYRKEKWFAWIREVQQEEEANDEKEGKKVKQEAALFKRHVKELGGRLAKEQHRDRRGDAKPARPWVKKNYDNVWGFQIVGTLENPYETHEKTAPMTNEEIESTVSDIRQIKHLLCCRLLLGQASMLPAALRANSVEELLNDPQVAESDLRDLCLKVEGPTLQDIRDACADFARGDEAEEG
ncbi:hypothetical protein LRP88_11559 [Fusarium phalaenopsidis]